MPASFDRSASCARALDAADPLKGYRRAFVLPRHGNKPAIYLTGNSLGLQPKKVRAYVNAELDDWGRLGVHGHLQAKRPWLPYHENLTAQTAELVGAKAHEVVVMNTLTVNLHLMLVSFYRPTAARNKILMEGGAFPSDQYAVASQVRLHGYDPEHAVVTLQPRSGETALRTADIVQRIAAEKPALVLLGNVNYYTGQAFDMAAITRAAHAAGSKVGFDLAHGAGNLPVQLHDHGPDFAVWCSYKYLNGGPGTLAGCFVHERHALDSTLPRLAGWWGHDKATRFNMPARFAPIRGAEGWQLSNPPILQMAALRASMELFHAAGMPALRRKSALLTAYLAYLLEDLPHGFVTLLTPTDAAARGAQLSLRVRGSAAALESALAAQGVVCDARQPDVLRAAPVPLYNTFGELYRFAKILRTHAQNS